VSAEPRPVRRWGPDRLVDLAVLCTAALPDEHLLAEDLEACCFDDPPADPDGGRVGPSITLGVDDGPDRPVGAVAVAIRDNGGIVTGHVQVLVVDPDHRRRGVGRELLRAAESEARSRGAVRMHLGAAAPFYLFTGVDSRWTEAMCLAEDAGYDRLGAELDLVCPTRFGPPAASGDVEVRAVREDRDVADLLGFAERCYPDWRAELARAGAAGTAVIAIDADRAVVGAAAHSVNRFGVIGPVGVDPTRYRNGVGAAMMHALATDLAVAGIDRAEIAWTSTVRFYAVACRARVLRAAVQYGRWL
jgi:GNAT superfamily N-acetyltransferase